MLIRLATFADQPQIVQLIGEILREYGETICLDNCDRDLLDLARNYFDLGGKFWVLQDSDRILGTVAVVPSYEPKQDPSASCWLKRLYLHSSLRGTDWGRRLMQLAVDWAQQSGYPKMEFWSDTRFARAHQFYRKFGCRMTGQSRTMHDAFQPYDEYHFEYECLAARGPQLAP